MPRRTTQRCGAIVITGLGRAFSAGLDMTTSPDMAGGERDTRRPPPSELPALVRLPPRHSQAGRGRGNGVAAGGGMVLAMMCDLRFAADTASFTTAFSKRGLIAEHGTAWLLPRLLGTSRALDLLWSARRIDAEEAYRMGFVDRSVPADQLIEETNRYLTELLSTVAPRSIATIKRQVYAGWSQTFAESTLEMSRVLAASLDHPDLKEGVASFVERRPPEFAPVGPEDRHPSPSNPGPPRQRPATLVSIGTSSSTSRAGRPDHAQPTGADELDDQPDGARDDAGVGRPVDERAVRVVVLTGAGKHYCPGADLQGVTTGSGSDARADRRRLPHAGAAARDAGRDDRARQRGVRRRRVRLGVGLRPARRYPARRSSTRRLLDVGVAGDMSGPGPPPRLVGVAKARELYFIPDKFTADEAHRIGLVARVFDDETFAVEASAVVDRLAHAAPQALRTMKANFLEAEQVSLAEFVPIESRRHMDLFKHPDTLEAFRARVEKRRPVWSS